MYTIKIHRIGDSLGITLPEEVLQQLNVGEGDNVFLIKTADEIQIMAGDPELERAMKAYRKVSQKYKNALRELAK